MKDRQYYVVCNVTPTELYTKSFGSDRKMAHHYVTTISPDRNPVVLCTDESPDANHPMTRIERRLVGQHFTDTPDNLTFRQLLDALVNDELPEDCYVWAGVEDMGNVELADHLRNLANALQEEDQ